MEATMFDDEESTMTWARMWQLVAAGALIWLGLVALGLWIVR